MGTSAVDQLALLLDHAFDGDQEHPLLANLHGVRAEDWRQRPPGGGRTIRAITYHAGVAKYLYADHLFGAATASYESVLRTAPATHDEHEMETVIAWLREGHRQMVDGVRTLTDEDLPVVVRAHWGEPRQRQQLIWTVIEHDTYHAGEINHLRALLQDDDKWPWQ
jgi:uncharacterized damage-inducible protein DinB